MGNCIDCAWKTHCWVSQVNKESSLRFVNLSRRHTFGSPLNLVRVRRLHDEPKYCLNKENVLSCRRLDGTSYNKEHVWWGAAREDVTRDVPAMYPDGIALPSGTCTPEENQAGKCRYTDAVNGFGSHRPPPRTVSNNLFQQVRRVVSAVDE